MSQGAWVGKRVLLVDDSDVVKEFITGLCDQASITVASTASNGLEALEKLKSDNFDIVFLDVIMPEMHGVECFNEIKKNKP